MTNPTDTNQASEDEQAMQHICQQTGEHYYASESIPGGLIHWIHICMACGHKDYEDLNEQVKALISTAVREARIDELEHIVSGSEYSADDFDWYEKTQDEYTGTRYYSEVRHLSKTDRIAELKRSKE